MAWLQREDLEDQEIRSLSRFASHNREQGTRRLPETEDPLRTAFQRDRDRIIHCAAFRRLQHKTQVLAAYEGDHFRSRMVHSLEVSQMARCVAGCLRLNRDLAEAVALAHDLGHPPFGHSGEAALDELMSAHGGFRHNAQGSRIVDLLEDRHGTGFGLNLCIATRRSLLKGRVPKGFPISEDLEPGILLPIEAQLVDYCDKIAYISHDLDDALRADVVTVPEIEHLTLWKQAHLRQANGAISQVISELASVMIHDLVRATDRHWNKERHTEPARMHHSESMQVTIAEMHRFLREQFYESERVLKVMNEGRERIARVFVTFVAKPSKMPDSAVSRIAANGLHRTICDYMAGMTDRFLLNMS